MHIGRKRNLQLSRENVLLRCKLRVATKKLGDLKQKNQNLEVQFIDAEKACEDLHTCWNQDSKEFQEEREDLLSTINTKDDTICQLEEDSSSLYAQIQQMREEEVHANKESQDVCHQLKNLYKVSQTNEGFIKRSEAGITDLKQQSVSLHLENDSLKHENNQLRIDAKKLREKLRAATSPKVQPSPEQGLSNLSLQGNDSDSDSGLDTNEDDTDTHTSRPRNFGLDQRARSRSNRSTSNATASASRQNPVSSERRRVYSAVKKLTDHQLSLLEPDISGVSRIIPGEGYHWVSGVSFPEAEASLVKLIYLQHTRMNPKNRPPGLEDDTSKLETKQRRLS
jgi:regulator of replication initiation timing